MSENVAGKEKLALNLDVSSLLTGATDMLPFACDIPFAGESVGQENSGNDAEVHVLPWEDVVFPYGAHISGSVVNKAGYMKLTFTASVPYRTHCARCLEPVAGELLFNAEKNVAEARILSGPEEKQEEDYVLIADNCLDISQPVYDEILLRFPSKHLYAETCKGLCPVCGSNLNETACGCTLKELDPRLAKLQALSHSDNTEGGTDDGSTEEKNIQSKKR